MKFLKWSIELKVKRIDGEQRIIYLVNRLIREINAQGHSVMLPEIADDFGSFGITMHNYGSDDAVIYIKKLNGFEFIGKPADGIK